MDCFTEPLCIDRALYREKLPSPYADSNPEGLFVSDKYKKLGGILFLNFSLIAERGFLWKAQISLNENAIPLVRLPEDLVSKVTSIKEIEGNLVETYTINNGCLTIRANK
jgi:hypothetical protein